MENEFEKLAFCKRVEYVLKNGDCISERKDNISRIALYIIKNPLFDFSDYTSKSLIFSNIVTNPEVELFEVYFSISSNRLTEVLKLA